MSFMSFMSFIFGVDDFGEAYPLPILKSGFLDKTLTILYKKIRPLDQCLFGTPQNINKRIILSLRTRPFANPKKPQKKKKIPVFFLNIPIPRFAKSFEGVQTNTFFF